MKRLRAGFPRFGLLSLLVTVGGTQAAVAQPWFTRNIGCAGTHWISLPRDTDLLTAEDLCAAIPGALTVTQRSEERRVGKECRSRWSANHYKKKRTEKDIAQTSGGVGKYSKQRVSV